MLQRKKTLLEDLSYNLSEDNQTTYKPPSYRLCNATRTALLLSENIKPAFSLDLKVVLNNPIERSVVHNFKVVEFCQAHPRGGVRVYQKKMQEDRRGSVFDINLSYHDGDSPEHIPLHQIKNVRKMLVGEKKLHKDDKRISWLRRCSITKVDRRKLNKETQKRKLAMRYLMSLGYRFKKLRENCGESNRNSLLSMTSCTTEQSVNQKTSPPKENKQSMFGQGYSYKRAETIIDNENEDDDDDDYDDDEAKEDDVEDEDNYVEEEDEEDDNEIEENEDDINEEEINKEISETNDETMIEINCQINENNISQQEDEEEEEQDEDEDDDDDDDDEEIEEQEVLEEKINNDSRTKNNKSSEASKKEEKALEDNSFSNYKPDRSSMKQIYQNISNLASIFTKSSLETSFLKQKASSTSPIKKEYGDEPYFKANTHSFTEAFQATTTTAAKAKITSQINNTSLQKQVTMPSSMYQRRFSHYDNKNSMYISNSLLNAIKSIKEEFNDDKRRSSVCNSQVLKLYPCEPESDKSRGSNTISNDKMVLSRGSSTEDKKTSGGKRISVSRRFGGGSASKKGNNYEKSNIQEVVEDSFDEDKYASTFIGNSGYGSGSGAEENYSRENSLKREEDKKRKAGKSLERFGLLRLVRNCN